MKHRRTLFALALAFVLLVFLSSAASAQTAVTLTGRVTDAQGNPLAGVWIVLKGSGGSETTTDADGRYAFSVPAGTYGLLVTNNLYWGCPWSGYGPYLPWCFRIESSRFDVTQSMTLDLPLPFKRVNVHVVDTNGQPIAGAALSTNNPTSDAFTLGGVSFTGTSSYAYDTSTGEGFKTDANGNATLLLLPVPFIWDHSYSITAYPPAETGLPAKSLEPLYIAGDTSLTISYVSSVTLSGRITDAQGNGLPNQSVELGGTASTDSSGYYTLSVSPGSYQMRIRGGVPVGSTLQAAQTIYLVSGYFLVAENRTLDLVLPFQRVNVHVVDANNQPVAGAGLSADPHGVDDLSFGGVTFYGGASDSSYWYDTSTGEGVRTDANGNATLWLLPASDQPWEGDGYTITAYAPPETGLDYATFFPVFVTGETNVTVRFNGALPGAVPVIWSLFPDSVPAQSPSFTLIVGGSGFVNSSVVRWNGADRSTTFVSVNQLTAVIPSTDIASPGTANVTVWTPPPGGGLSNSLPFTINPPSATINVYAALHTVGSGTTSGDQKTPLALSLKVFDRATFPSAELKDYATVWNSGPGLEYPLARITGPSVTTFSNGLANLYIVKVPAADSSNKMTSGRYLVIGKVNGEETYVGAATDPLAVDSVTDEYFQVTQKSDGQIVPYVATSNTPTPTAKATQTPKPKPTATPTPVPTSKAPKPSATPKKQPNATPTAASTKLSTATPTALPTQTSMPPATRTPKKQPTATPMATWTQPPTKTPHLTPTPRNTPTKH
jgi:hypothetical protein